MAASIFDHAPRAERQTGIGRGGIAGRIVLIVCLGLIEATLISFFYDTPRTEVPPSLIIGLIWQFASSAVHAAILIIGAFAILNWHQRRVLLQEWHDSLKTHRFVFWLLVNLAFLIVTILASIAISSDMETYERWLWPYFALLAVFAATLMLTVAPAPFWQRMLATTWMSLVLSIAAATFVLLFSTLAKTGWAPLAGATLNVTHAILSLYESNILVDVAATPRIAVGEFVVEISPACSGYEGIGLVTAVVSLYLYVFRRELRFPQALFLLPIGITAIWLLNAVRIAALVSLGAHVSPHIAIGGFHSQAGWIVFLIVSVAVMILGQRAAFFHQTVSPAVSVAEPAPQENVREHGDALAWLAPFMALMTASIIAAAFVPNDQWLYGLRVVFIAAALWTFRAFYATIVERVAPLSLLAGLAVGIAWIATDPDPSSGAELGKWILALPMWATLLWLALRAAGTIIFVPIAEEMAFRGFLYRTIAAQRIAGVTPLIMTAVAFIVTSLLFGAIHQRWLAGMLAGAVYALVMYRTNRMSDPIAAHMASNAVIIAWAIAVGQWSLI